MSAADDGKISKPAIEERRLLLHAYDADPDRAATLRVLGLEFSDVWTAFNRLKLTISFSSYDEVIDSLIALARLQRGDDPSTATAGRGRPATPPAAPRTGGHKPGRNKRKV